MNTLEQKETAENVSETHEGVVSESEPERDTVPNVRHEEAAISAQKPEVANVASGGIKLCLNCGDIWPEEATKCLRCGHGFG